MITAFRSPGVCGGWRVWGVVRERETDKEQQGVSFPLSLSGLFHSLFLVEDEERQRCLGFCAFPNLPFADKRKQGSLKLSLSEIRG